MSKNKKKLIKVLTIRTTFLRTHTTVYNWVYLKSISLPVRCVKVEKKLTYACTCNRPNGRTNFDIDFMQSPHNFYGTKITQKNWPCFSIFLLIYFSFLGRNEFLPSFATPTPQFAKVTIFLDFLNLWELLQASQLKKIKKIQCVGNLLIELVSKKNTGLNQVLAIT